MTDMRSSSALFKRAEQLKRWEESETNSQSTHPKRPSKIRFAPGLVFLAACAAGDKEEAERLLQAGADINTADVDGITGLHQACINDNLDMVEFLVANGADVSRGDNEGWTPLHATASCGYLSIAKYLTENNADVTAVNNDGDLPVDITEEDAMRLFLQEIIDNQGVNCDAHRNAEATALLNDAKYWAANGFTEIHDSKGGTPLHVAAAKGYLDVLKILLEDCNANPDSADCDGWTPLHAAAHWAQEKACLLLLKNGADPGVLNCCGLSCLDVADPSISLFLIDAALKNANKVRNINNNNDNRRKRPTQQPNHDAKRIDVQNDVNNKPAKPSETGKAPDGKPPKAPPSPDSRPERDTEEEPSWRRTASLRTRQNDVTRDTKPITNSTPVPDTDTVLRRTHSLENDKTIPPKAQEAMARSKAASCPTIPPNQWQSKSIELRRKQETPSPPIKTETNEEANRISPAVKKERDGSNWSQSPVRRSFVPPVRDDESETQRKAHAKRVRETRRSTQGVTLDELKSAEQLVKKKTGNGAPASPTEPPAKKADKDETTPQTVNQDETFELEDEKRANQRAGTEAVPATVTLPLRRTQTAPITTPAPAPPPPVDASAPAKRYKEENDKTRENETRAGTNSWSSPSTQATLNVIQRRRRSKRRSTGICQVDPGDPPNDSDDAEGDADSDSRQSGSERTVGPTSDDGEPDYKALYEASAAEVRTLRDLLNTSEQQLRDARSTITRLTQLEQNSMSEVEKRERRAMERKLSEMEEELKCQQHLQIENQRLKDENGALIRVISKLSK